MHLQVLYEDNHIIAINKPAGYLVQGDETGDTPLSEHVKKYIKIQYNKPGDVFLGVIHRLDRPVSGVLLFARTSKALSRMNEQFMNRDVEKVYWAITHGQPDPLEGELLHFLVKDKEKNITKAYDTMSRRAEGAKRAELTYRMLGRIGHFCLQEVRPLTGRPHQIRVQLSRNNTPIKGDLKYGAPTPNTDGSISLHCRALRFLHPVKKEWVHITALPPKLEGWELFKGFEVPDPEEA
ncbi:MAG: RluA family pseudouridine synthase [Saprospiraceae bacterium]